MKELRQWPAMKVGLLIVARDHLQHFKELVIEAKAIHADGVEKVEKAIADLAAEYLTAGYYGAHLNSAPRPPVAQR